MANMYKSVLASGGTQPTGNAVPADVLSGKTFSNDDGVGKVGTMVNNGAVSGTATPTQPYTIPAGYHNGSGVVTASGGVTELSAVAGTRTGNTTFTFDISSLYNDYSSLTIDNIIIELTKASIDANNAHHSLTLAFTYDSTTGIITATNSGTASFYSTATFEANIYIK